ncbi:hypothetical protein, partial [Klebsiella aerogenes]|uniref:hypothetical protein n=1 Tax=Klebsiella aerogenes TaxID=548 RepID=UPI001D0D16DB
IMIYPWSLFLKNLINVFYTPEPIECGPRMFAPFSEDVQKLIGDIDTAQPMECGPHSIGWAVSISLISF